MSTIEHTRTDSDLPARALRAIPGGVNSGQRRVSGLEQTIVTATDGATFTDGEGRTYVDFHSAFGPRCSATTTRTSTAPSPRPRSAST